MKRVAIIADSHFSESSRFAECLRLHDWIADDIRTRGVDLILHAGDVFDAKSTPTERAAVAAWLRWCAEIAPVVIVRGNHDVVGDLAIFAKLRTKHPVIVEEAAGVHVVAGVAVACLAWPRKAALLASAREAGMVGSEQLATECMRNVLRGMGDQLAKHDGPRILLAHAMVSGSKTSTGQPLVGCDMELGIEDIALARADFNALGHIHLPQDWYTSSEGGEPVVYPGSPRRTAFGETEDKGYVVAEFVSKLSEAIDRSVDGQQLGQCLEWQRVVAPATPMVLIDAVYEYSADDGRWMMSFRSAPIAGAEVRCRYTVPSDRRDEAKAVATTLRESLVRKGAISVKLEEQVIATTRARTPEITTAVTLNHKLILCWEARGIKVDPDRAGRIFTKLNELEITHAV